MLRRLISYWHTAKKETFIGGLMLVLATFIDLMQPWPVKWLVDYVFGNHSAPTWLTLLWPDLPPVDGDPLAAVIERLESGLTADLHPVFGEVFSLRIVPAAP